MKKVYVPAAVLAGMLALLCGCSGEMRETVPGQEPARESGTVPGQMVMEADEDRIAAILQALTESPRPGGSEGETAAAEYIRSYLDGLGYEVSLMPFTQKASREGEQTVSGTNVEAVRRADRLPDLAEEKADIIFVGAHHDGAPASRAALDGASGVAVMLEAARLVKEVPSNKEIRFVSFSGEKDGGAGSRFYVEQLTEEERDRAAGQIQLDEIGYRDGSSLALAAADGRNTFLGGILMEQAGIYGVPVAETVSRETMGCHNSFVSGGIPAVELSIGETAYENRSVMDTMEIVDAGLCADAAALVADVLARVMTDEKSCVERSRAVSPIRGGYTVRRETELWFGMSRNFVENRMGLSGVPVGSETGGPGGRDEIYRYPVRWFGMDQPMETEYRYRGGVLEEVDIPYQETTGADLETAAGRITAALGEPTETFETGGGAGYGWGNPVYHKYYRLEPGEGGYRLSVTEDSSGRNMGGSYELDRVPGGTGGPPPPGSDAPSEPPSPGSDAPSEPPPPGSDAPSEPPSPGSDAPSEPPLPGPVVLAEVPERDRKLLELAAEIVYPEDRSMVTLQIYSDGLHNSSGYTSALSYDDNSRMVYCLDEDDAFEEGGAEWRDFRKTQRVAVHEYGHVVSLNAGQVDTGVEQQDESMPALFYPKEKFAENAYLRAYYRRFWNGMPAGSGGERYRQAPEEFVSEYASGSITEDFAESFAMFVLAERPEGDTVAEQKILFFYDYEELLARRGFIRGNLGLEGGTYGS